MNTAILLIATIAALGASLASYKVAENHHDLGRRNQSFLWTAASFMLCLVGLILMIALSRGGRL
jgi:hypothetical protein